MDSLTDTQRAILNALQRPLREGGPYASPATNREIAGQVHLSVDAVKGHLRALYARLGLEDLPQNAKRSRLAEIGVSGALDGTLPPRPPEPAPALARRSERGRIPAMLAAVALGLVLLGVVVGLMLGHDGGDTIISQEPGFDQPGNPGRGEGGKRSLLGQLPGPWSDDGLFAAGPAVPAGHELSPGSAGAAPVSERTEPRRRRGDRTEAKARRRDSAAPRQRPASPAPTPPPAAPAVTPAQTQRTCITRRQVSHRPVTVTVRRVRLVPQRVRRRVVRYRQEVRMVPVQRQVPNGNGRHKGRNRKNAKGHQGGGTHTETVYVRQVRRVPVVRWVTRTRMRRQVRPVKVTRRQRVVRTVRSCR